MKDEIKIEIRSIEQQAIDNLKSIVNCKDKIIEIEPPLEDTCQIILDYITNLQERNEKAIEYIKENQYIKIHEEGFTHEGEEYYILPNSDIVLDILQGEDNS